MFGISSSQLFANVCDGLPGPLRPAIRYEFSAPGKPIEIMPLLSDCEPGRYHLRRAIAAFIKGCGLQTEKRCDLFGRGVGRESPAFQNKAYRR